MEKLIGRTSTTMSIVDNGEIFDSYMPVETQSMLIPRDQNLLLRIPDRQLATEKQGEFQSLLTDVHQDPEGFLHYVHSRRKDISFDSNKSALDQPNKMSMKDFHLNKAIGKGKFSTVYYCKEISTDKEYAVKRVPITKKVAEKEGWEGVHLKEVGLLQSLNHPFIIKCYSVFLEDAHLCIVLEWAGGGDLQMLLRAARRRGLRFPEALVLQYAHQMAAALEHMHARRVLHRDLKPSNVLLTAGGALKLGDFGLGRYLGKRTVMAYTQVGTPLYMSPEVLRGVGHGFGSDVWSLGCVVYELAAGHSPFLDPALPPGEKVPLGPLFRRILEGRYPALRAAAGHGPALRRLVGEGLLVVDPARRWGAAAAAAALAAARGGAAPGNAAGGGSRGAAGAAAAPAPAPAAAAAGGGEEGVGVAVAAGAAAVGGGEEGAAVAAAGAAAAGAGEEGVAAAAGAAAGGGEVAAAAAAAEGVEGAEAAAIERKEGERQLRGVDGAERGGGGGVRLPPLVAPSGDRQEGGGSATVAPAAVNQRNLVEYTSDYADEEEDEEGLEERQQDSREKDGSNNAHISEEGERRQEEELATGPESRGPRHDRPSSASPSRACDPILRTPDPGSRSPGRRASHGRRRGQPPPPVQQPPQDSGGGTEAPPSGRGRTEDHCRQRRASSKAAATEEVQGGPHARIGNKHNNKSYRLEQTKRTTSCASSNQIMSPFSTKLAKYRSLARNFVSRYSSVARTSSKDSQQHAPARPPQRSISGLSKTHTWNKTHFSQQSWRSQGYCAAAGSTDKRGNTYDGSSLARENNNGGNTPKNREQQSLGRARHASSPLRKMFNEQGRKNSSFHRPKKVAVTTAGHREGTAAEAQQQNQEEGSGQSCDDSHKNRFNSSSHNKKCRKRMVPAALENHYRSTTL